MFLRKNNRLEALIGHNTELKGEIISQGTLRIDGKFAGNITAEWVILGEDGSVTGNLKAKSVIIGGKINGNIIAEELIEIKHTGQLFGDIYTKKLSVAEGGIFEGHSHIQKTETNIIDFPNKETATT